MCLTLNCNLPLNVNELHLPMTQNTLSTVRYHQVWIYLVMQGTYRHYGQSSPAKPMSILKLNGRTKKTKIQNNTS